MKRRGIARFLKRRPPLVMVTAYDTPTAALLDFLGVDCILVGDSVGTVLLGYPSTRDVTVDDMVHHAQAVVRGTRRTCVVVDVPFKGLRGTAGTLDTLKKLMRTGCDAVKIEWSSRAALWTRASVRSRIPVMGHVGLTPQAVRPGEPFKVRGTRPRDADEILKAALAFESSGAFAVVLECVPAGLAEKITRALAVPVIGIGAGPHCDGQVLVFQDIVGLTQGFRPKFLKSYGNAYASQKKAVHNFMQDVKTGRYPSRELSYT